MNFSIKWGETEHKPGSPKCLETCSEGIVPIRITRYGYHVIQSKDYIKDIIADDGRHLICLGHGYDDYGSIDVEFIRQIVQDWELARRYEDLCKKALRV